MIDPLRPLFVTHHVPVASILPNAADPVAAHWLMIVGLAIVVATALWAIGGLAAAVWTLLSDCRDRHAQLGLRHHGRLSHR